MPLPSPTNSQYAEPGRWDTVNMAGDDVIFGSSSGSYSGPTTVTANNLFPAISPGEMYAYHARLSISSEPTDDDIVFAALDEPDNNYIQKCTIPVFTGNQAEIHTIVDYDMTGSSSDTGDHVGDLNIEVKGSDSANYDITVYVIQLRQPDDTNSRILGANDAAQTFD